MLALMASLLAIAVSAAGAQATIVVPPAKAITAESKATVFLPENAYSPISVRCTGSVAKFTTPPGRAKGGGVKVGIDQNMNRTLIGTQSSGPGGVWMDLTEPPTFTGCQVFNESEVVGPATVKTNATNGSWSLSLTQSTESTGWGAIAVPKGGATIEALGATLVISPTQSTAVLAPSFNNSAHTLTVDSQIAFSGGAAIGLVSPAQFEALYTANNSLEVLP
jgi:hypothetical protein